MVLGMDMEGGAMFTRHLEEDVLHLGPGDFVMLFTDGVTEASGLNGERFDEGRLYAGERPHDLCRAGLRAPRS